VKTMSGRRSRGSVSEEEINELISRLQTLLPTARRRGSSSSVDDENAQGDVQLHQEPAQGSGRPQRPPLRPHVHHGQQQPRRRDHPQPPPL
uniref:Uncharacterized protein n=1 Tax=Aegilops tauschii subsp. strangulata TaxID=200361 RepID=A0A453R604_AEGTS